MFDGQVVRPPQEFRDVARDYVCVRLTNINNFDLNLFPFDNDLTMAIVLANADGTVYHRYGGRDSISPMNMGTLVEIMDRGLGTHREYATNPKPPETKPPLRFNALINDQLAERIKPVYGCYHCHYAREARQYLDLEGGQWTPDKFWIWPLPKQIGLIVNQTRQNEVEHVIPKSAADVAGVRVGDIIQTLGENRILSQYDIQWVLDQTPDAEGSLPFTVLRNQMLEKGELVLESEWKVGDPKDYHWRVRNVFTEHMLKFLPAPGFIGKGLSPSELISLKLHEDQFALKITQLNYGTYLAGIRMGDIILSAADKSEFPTLRHFYHWCEQLRRSGRDIRMRLIRQESVMSVMVSLNYLNYSRVEQAPRVMLGFIAQELPANGGLRVGNVTDDSSAEKTGLLIGDKIVSIEGRDIRTAERLTNILSGKSPGDVLTITVNRDGEPLQFGFILPGAEESKSDLARLSGKVSRSGQELDCLITMKVPPDKHIYSVHQKGFGMPTQLDFRGKGFELIGAIEEPRPRKIGVGEDALEPMWVLNGIVEFRQSIRITDPKEFHLVLRVYAQVCDDQSCHEFQSIVANDGLNEEFIEFQGRFNDQSIVLNAERH